MKKIGIHQKTDEKTLLGTTFLGKHQFWGDFGIPGRSLGKALGRILGGFGNVLEGFCFIFGRVLERLGEESPEDFVIATGRMETVRRFCELTANKLGWSKGGISRITWEKKGIDEIGRRTDNGEIVIKIDPRYYRPTEVQELLGDATKAKNILNWEPKITLEQLVSEMVDEELKSIK